MYVASRTELLEICRLVYDRYLTNAAGSNFSARASEESVYVSISGNAKRNRLRMTPDEIIHARLDGTRLEGEGKVSQSWPTHLRMYTEFASVGAVIHAHPRYATALACRPEPMPPVLDAMKKYGEIPVLPRKLAVDSEEFADEIVRQFAQRRAALDKHGMAVFYPYHGVLAVGPTLDDVYDLLERIEYNAHAIIANAIVNIAGGYDRIANIEEGGLLE